MEEGDEKRPPDPKPPDKTKRTRADRAAKLQKRKLVVETVVKKSLSGSIQSKISNETKALIKTALEERIERCSKRTHLASVAINLWVKKAFDGVQDVTTVELPTFWESTFTRQLMLGTEGTEKPYSCIRDLHIAYPQLLLNTTLRNLLDRNIYSSASNKYSTNLKNHLILNLPKLIKMWVYQHEEFTHEEHISMLYHINGWSSTRELPMREGMIGVIQEARRVLGLAEDDKINKPWLKAKENLPSMLRFSIFVNRFLEWKRLQAKTEEEASAIKLRNIFPICRMKRHFITIDTSSLYGLMKEVELVDTNFDTFNALRLDQWKSLFDLPSWKKKTFTGTIDTDGVALNIHYQHDRQVLDPEEGETSRKEQPLSTHARVIGVDPGRSNILYMAEITESGAYRTYRLTRNQYYLESGIINANKLSLEWNKSLKNEIKLLSEHTPKGASLASFLAYLNVRDQVANAMWSEYFKKRWSHQRLRLYGGKKRTMARFLNRIEKDDPSREVILAYGSAKFAPGGRGEMSVPTTRVFKECTYRFKTRVIDEFRTTRIHYGTDQVLQGVGERQKNENGKNAIVSVRGLLWFKTTEPGKASKFVNRDLNAALNIRRCALLPKRPPILDRSKCTRALPKQTFGKII